VFRTVIASAPAPATNSLPQDPAVREIPGFYYDLEKNKYFKITANHTLGGHFAFSQQSIKEKTIQKVQTCLAVLQFRKRYMDDAVLIQIEFICLVTISPLWNLSRNASALGSPHRRHNMVAWIGFFRINSLD
jgi:hypothetical protein